MLHITDLEIDNFKRCLFHEIGHHTAHELNKRIYNSGLGTNKILIKKAKLENDFNGETQPIYPKNYNLFDPVKNIPGFIAVQIYGCLFGCLYKKSNFYYDCFNLNSSGKEDVERLELINGSFSNDKNQLILQTIYHHIKNIESNRDHFDKYLFNINLDELNIISNESEFEINIKKLNAKLDLFFSIHSAKFEEFINKLREILN